MVWLSPAAFLGLVAIAGPIVVHLLRRRHARRIVVPSVRFIAAADESAVRLRRVSDPWLLLLRIAIVVAAVLALARPVVFTRTRLASWGDRVSRAVLVDSSESARAAMTTELVAAQESGADPVTTLEARDLAIGLKRAAAWLGRTPPSRREIVVVSDFQRGALSHRDVTNVPAEVGLRFVRAGPASRPLEPERVRVMSGETLRSGEIQMDADSTSVSFRSEATTWDGLQILADPADEQAVRRLLRVISRAGTAAPAREFPIVVRFTGGAALPAGPPVIDDWTFAAGQRLLQTTRTLEVPVRVSARAASLLVDVAVRPGSLQAAEVSAAALNARVDPADFLEREPATISSETLAGWTRDPAAPDAADWASTDSSDGRFLWGLSLLLLGAEAVLRGRSRRIPDRVEAHAA